MSFTEDMQARTAAIWRAAKEHPFLQQLVTDELPHETFLYYIHQDAWFLREEAKVLAIAAARAGDLATTARLSELISAVNAAEQNRHRSFAERLGRPIDDAHHTPSPTAYAYVAHLRSVALDAPLAPILAALLPCPWLYCDFGRHFFDHEPADPIYAEWLAAYKSELLDERVGFQRRLLDAEVEKADAPVRLAAERAFEISIHYEFRFWEMAVAREEWPSGTVA
jgi:thiaminase/transcriptional activator TenA